MQSLAARDRFALLVACLGMHVCSQASSNRALVEARHALARTYNDRSVQENASANMVRGCELQGVGVLGGGGGGLGCMGRGGGAGGIEGCGWYGEGSLG